MEIMITPAGLLFASLIFGLRVLNYAISTIRLVFIARSRRLYAASLAFVEAFLFAVVMAQVITDVNNSLINLFAYCIGASVGSYVGMAIESRFVVSYSTVSIITHTNGKAFAETMRLHGYGATITYGEGRDGEVAIIRSSMSNRDLPNLLALVRKECPDAFVEVEAARTLVRGWYPGSNNSVNVVGR